MTNPTVRRRDVLALVGCSAAAWPRAARAQEVKRLGVLMNGDPTDLIAQMHLATFVEGMRKLGWVEGQNLRMGVRWNAGDPSRTDAYATDLVELLRPDVLVSVTTINLIALMRATKTIPIVFLQSRDPVMQGLVSNLTRPGGNVTGFANSEFSIAGKWADLLKQMVPTITRIAAVYNPEGSPQSQFYLNALQSAAQALAVEIVPVHLKTPSEVEPTFARLSQEGNFGVILLPGFAVPIMQSIVSLVAHYRLPAIYGQSDFVRSEDGLMHYGNDLLEQFRQAPYYVDRILKGTKPGDLPIQLPTKFKLTVNRKTATALGIDVPLGILLAADEVIE